MGQAKLRKEKMLSKKQIEVIDELYDGNNNEMEVIKKFGISRNIYRKWLNDKNFTDELAFRFDSARRQSEMIIAKYAPAAAVKLVELAESEKDETARKACLNIMEHPISINRKEEKVKSKTAQGNISPEVAGRLLAALAKENRQNI
jgi:hypothetical protein